MKAFILRGVIALMVAIAISVGVFAYIQYQLFSPKTTATNTLPSEEPQTSKTVPE